jgi:CheY-like chemotaxis protein
MQLAAMTVGLLRRALAVYDQEAWGSAAPPAVEVPGSDDDAVDEALARRFKDDSAQTGDTIVRRYVLQRGNPRYPFMKLVLQEHLVEGEFFFEVDTHDQMFDLDGDEGREFAEVKRYNLDVKHRVEEAWGRARLPTAAHLKGLVETRPTRRSQPNGRSLLVVDDDRDIADTLALLLEARGYRVTTLDDGRDVVEQADPTRHDLILMDNEMVHLSGFEACRVLKSQERTRSIPVLIATAGSLTLRQLDDADGFLVKPFRMELLFSMLEHLLGRP